MLTDDSTKAKWAQEGLPTDPLSVENGAITTNAARWCLMIDPQLQVGWIRVNVCSLAACIEACRQTSSLFAKRCGVQCLVPGHSLTILLFAHPTAGH